MSDKDREECISLHQMLTATGDDYIAWVRIPKIQRDYAQGRDGEESLRSRFLDSLFDVIDSNEDTEIVLDFVFGQKEGVGETATFYPVDGQQRLTTLFLLHLYIGKRAGENVEFLRKFSYETRKSSEQFCQRVQNISSDDFHGIRDHIESQWWYTGLWRTDPTIKAMLNMLSDIDAHYIEKDYGSDDFNRVWKRLKERVKFWRLNLSDLNTTDELYIKMNSRGKKLTDFEHFKAMLDEYAQTGGRLSAKIDTAWTNLLWRYHDSKSDLDLDTDDYVNNGLDICFHNLLLFYLNVEGCKRGYVDFQSPVTDLMKLASIVLGFKRPSDEVSDAELKELKAKKVSEARDIMSRLERIMDFFSFQDLTHKYIHEPETFFGEFIQCGYDSWSEKAADNVFLDNSQKIFIGKRNHPDLLRDVCDNGLPKNNPTIYLEAFFQYVVSNINQTVFQNRLRLLRNIVENTEIHARDFKNTLLVVDELIANGNMSLAGVNDELNKTQKDQESFKITWLTTHKNYENLLYAVENHWLLMGNLNALIEYGNDNKPVDINIVALKRFGRLFNSSCDYMLIERALLTVGDYSPMPKVKEVKPYGGSNWGRWKDLIQSFNRTTPQVLQAFLCNNNDFSNKGLDNIINNANSVNYFPWEYYLRTYESIYSATRAKYRYLGGKYSYQKLNANGGGGSEYFWNPYNQAVGKLLDDKGIGCTVDGGGGVLTLGESNISVDIKEASIEVNYPDDSQFVLTIPQDNTEIDIINRIEFSAQFIRVIEKRSAECIRRFVKRYPMALEACKLKIDFARTASNEEDKDESLNNNNSAIADEIIDKPC